MQCCLNLTQVQQIGRGVMRGAQLLRSLRSSDLEDTKNSTRNNK